MGVTQNENPKLRLVDAQPVNYEGMKYLYLRDPLALTDKTLLVPEPYIPLLALSDGTRPIPTLRAALALRYGLFLTNDRVTEFIEALDDTLLLENERSNRARIEARAAFRAQPFRAPASAGLSYPSDPKELSGLLQGYMNGLNGRSRPRGGDIRGIVSPHIDYQRGGPVYAEVWSAAAQSVREAELVIIFGTDHFSEGFPFSLTRQSYATPFGVLPTETVIVDRLARAIGPSAFDGELHHRSEHSIELAAVWMHHIRGGEPVATVPILTGQVSRAHSGGAVDVDSVIAVLQEAARGRKVIVVAAGDLAHVGPAFGGDPVDPGKRLELTTADEELIAHMCGGDAEGFFSAIERVEDQNNVCGVSPIYLTLRMLAPINGRPFGYSVCPADEDDTSVVTICGVTLGER